VTDFQTIERGQKYAVPITLANGFDRRILVKKTERLNPSVRGGAYKTEWHAYNGGMNLSVRGETRQEAHDKAIAILTERGAL
jgi:hypothetical protein